MSLTILVNGALGLLPVLAFLAMLIQSDTFKLVRRNYVAMLIVSGAAAALTAYFASKALMRETGVNYDAFIQFIGPLLEEALKALIVMLLIRSNRIGFVPDALPDHSDITVHVYLDFFARAYGIRVAARREVVESVEEFTNLTGIREKLLKALSKGMKPCE